ncbi:MATE family efflux transporter [Amphiplicatus metriothermophilus]|uniref:Multidrug resistance protein, MATE family n=1 Tax=Amphiplicatus metriothermophilus TaxID=1519374 RepID=A0A239PLG0_9PROT|nr:MATE family efflux transporter [Amphiplicatus metriothermophilus]MBB5517259.1 MATE family multidrug resistance protein [Amphiplicatus metriothermophilus]SNT68405.1 multidrug resistance protein, MATE family [Amphiplicatus metriothermophilus]
MSPEPPSPFATSPRPAPARPAVSYGEILRLAWPASLAASATPLLGVVDVWALARSDRPLDIAAVGLGAVIFSLAYWTFGFIRMSTAGLAAQAAGAEDEAETRAALYRGATLGAAIGLALVVLQLPLGAGAFAALAFESQASAATLEAARSYFDIRIWGAPFALATYAALGWFSGRGRTDCLMAVSLTMTGLNAALDYWFAVGLGWGARGVAAGTLIAEIAGFLLAAGFAARMMARRGGLRLPAGAGTLFSIGKIRRTVAVNRDIFLRTVLLAFSFAWFVQRGGAFGDATLAANQTLLQLFLFTGLALDGTAIAAEALVGQAIGARDRAAGLERYRTAVRRTFVVAGCIAVAFAAAYGLFGEAIIAFLTPEGAIREAASRYLPWVAASPLVVVIGFQLDGVFVGATRAREMRDSMFLAAPAFILSSLWLAAHFGNHGLWAAFTAYFLIRAATLGLYMPRIARSFAAA